MSVDYVCNNRVTAFPMHTMKLSMALMTKDGRGFIGIHCCSGSIVEWATQSALVEVAADSCEYFLVADLAAVSVLV